MELKLGAIGSKLHSLYAFWGGSKCVKLPIDPFVGDGAGGNGGVGVRARLVVSELSLVIWLKKPDPMAVVGAFGGWKVVVYGPAEDLLDVCSVLFSSFAALWLRHAQFWHSSEISQASAIRLQCAHAWHLALY